MHKLKIKEYRQLQGLTQKDLAKMSRISQGYLSSLESNKKSPTVRVLFKISNSLHICPCMLIKHKNRCKYKKD